MSGTSMSRILVIVVVGAILGVGVYFAPKLMTKETKPPALPFHDTLAVGGTSTADLIIENGWRTAYKMQNKIQIDYKSDGSTKGVAQMIKGTYPIAFTHAPLTEAQKKEAKDKGELVQVPAVLCSVVPIYNVEELKKKPPLKFTGEVLAKIFLGKIKKWNDPELKKINEGVALPDTKITVVHREDSSGTTSLFTDYLATVSPEWKEKVGKGSKVEWPVGEAEKRSENLVKRVQKTEGAIGYVDLVYATFWALPYGSVQNKDKEFIHAKAKNITAAAQENLSEIHDDMGFDLINKPGKESYPISGAIWAVCYQNQPATDRKKVVDFLQWVTDKDGGQTFATTAYAQLPKELASRVETKLKTIKIGKDSK